MSNEREHEHGTRGWYFAYGTSCQPQALYTSLTHDADRVAL